MIPDTVVVINRTIAPTDYTPLIIGFSAPILVALVTGINIYVQRKIADKAVETQQKLGADTIAVQREIAAQTVRTQLEIATKQNVVQSRREWGRDLRATVSNFRSVAGSLRLTAYTVEGKRLKLDQSTIEKVTELDRLRALIRLYMDMSKESHRQIFATVSAVYAWATGREDVEASRTETPDIGRFKEARKYKSIGEAFVALDNQIAAILESNWEKIKQGK